MKKRMPTKLLLLGVLLSTTVALGCKQPTTQQWEALRAKAIQDEAPAASSPVEPPREAANSLNMPAGWAAGLGTQRAGLQNAILGNYLTYACWRAWSILGREPQSVADLEAAGVLFVAPADTVGHPLPYSDGGQVSPAVQLHWQSDQVELAVQGRRAQSSQMTNWEGHIDLAHIRRGYASDQARRQQHGGSTKPAVRHRQELLAQVQADCLLMFITDQARFPTTYGEVLAFADLQPIAAGQPVAQTSLPAIGSLLLEVSEVEKRVRWRVVQEDGSYRAIKFIVLDEQYQPIAGAPGNRAHRDQSSYHQATEGWRTIATFQL